MLSVESLSVVTRDGKALLRELSFSIGAAEFVVVIGPSGCGKSTLIKALACGGGSSGRLASPLPPSLLGTGYLPQRSSLHDHLSVEEIVDFALRLRTGLAAGARSSRSHELLQLCGATPFQAQRSMSLSGGQLRRAALAELLTSDPPLLLLDELTSGLDPHAEREIMHVLADLVRHLGKTVVLVTHSVRNLDLADRVLMLKEGSLVYNGTPSGLVGSSGARDIEELYSFPVAHHPPWEDLANFSPPPFGPVAPVPPSREKPNPVAQFLTLLIRQSLLFSRDRSQVLLHLALIITFPLLVVLFAFDGLPLIKSLPLNVFSAPPLEAIAQQAQWKESSFRAGSLVSGLAMFQIILLTLMGANNGAREIARESDINEKEFAAGIHPLGYVLQKSLFVGLLSLVQAAWMAWLVSVVCGFPGALFAKIGALFLLTFAVSACCLAISAASRSPEKASLLSIYLVGFQLPLSGAVLALPEAARLLFQPFVSAYWGWCAYLRTFEDSTYYDVASQVTGTTIANFDLSLVVLAIHAILGITAAFLFLKRTSQQPRAKN